MVGSEVALLQMHQYQIQRSWNHSVLLMKSHCKVTELLSGGTIFGHMLQPLVVLQGKADLSSFHSPAPAPATLTDG